MQTPESISVIIPTRNESESLPSCLVRVWDVPEVKEIIVVDASDDQHTVNVAELFGARVFLASAGRGSQIALGADKASHSIIWILHADNWPHPQSGHAIRQLLGKIQYSAGAFTKKFRESTWLNFGAEFRCSILHNMAGIRFGDQGVFFRKSVLESIGGFPQVPLMEEFEFFKKIKKHSAGKIGLIPLPILTSSRKFQKHGSFKVYWIMARVLALYYMGTKPEELVKIYR